MKKARSSKAKKRILVFLALCMVAVIGVGQGIAYLTDFDEATNKFTLGKVDIDQEESNWKNPVKAVTAINGETAGKSDLNGDAVMVGDILTYSITATNGDIEARNIVIEDTIEAGLTVDVASISNGGIYDEATRKITWSMTDVPRLSDVTVYFKAAVNENATTSMKVENDAWAKVGNEAAKQSNKASNPLSTEPQDPTKKVSETSESGKNGSSVTINDQITYKIIGYNNTDAAGTVTIVDDLDSKVSYVSSTEGGVYDAATHTVTWTFTDMAAHSSKMVTLTVKVDAVYNAAGTLEPIQNDADVTDPENTYTSDIVNIPTRDPSTPKKPEKTYDNTTAAGFGGAKVNVGDVITYRISFYNHESTAQQVVITDVIDDGLTVDTATISNDGVYDEATRTITWTIAAAPAQSNGFVTFKATVNEYAVVKVANQAKVAIGENVAISSNKLVNPVEDPTEPGDTEIKDPTITAADGDSYMRFRVTITDQAGNKLTDVDQINKVFETLYYDTSYVYQGTVADPSTLTTNIVHGEAYTKAELQAMVDAGLVYKEYNQAEFTYDTTRTADPAVRYYNYTANSGIFADGAVATLFTNVVFPSDWDGTDFVALGDGYLIKVMAQACQTENFTQDTAFEELDKQAPTA